MNANQAAAGVLEKVFGASAASGIGRTFRFMELAEEELLVAGRKSDKVKKRLAESGTFRSLIVTPVLRDKSEALYRAHCQEMIARMLNGEPTQPASKAEMCAHLSDLSLVRQLPVVRFELYCQLFSELFPDVKIEGGADIKYKSRKSARDSLVANLQEKLMYEER